MYAEWPDSVAKYDKWKEERDSTGRVIFRGPRCVCMCMPGLS